MSKVTGRKLRVAWLSFWQAHSAPAPELFFPGPGTIAKAMKHPELDIVATWDEDQQRGRNRSDRLGLRFVENIDDILGSPDIDGVLVSTATSLHREIIVRAAQAGKHVHSAKVLSPEFAEAREIVSAADNAGIVLVTDLGWLYKHYVLRTKEIIDSGTIGSLVNLRVAHFHSMASAPSPVDEMGYYPDGHGFLRQAEARGGALVDMCHPMYVIPYLCDGLPTTAYARFGSITKRGDVEDNAVVIYDYQDGPYVIVEASWLTAPMTTEIEVNGTLGSLLYRSVYGIPDAQIFVLRTGDDRAFLQVDPGEDQPSTLDLWVNHIRNGTRADENIARALDLAKLNEAAYRSAEIGSPVRMSSIDS